MVPETGGLHYIADRDFSIMEFRNDYVLSEQKMLFNKESLCRRKLITLAN